jgi:hypothetical protein
MAATAILYSINGYVTHESWVKWVMGQVSNGSRGSWGKLLDPSFTLSQSLVNGASAKQVLKCHSEIEYHKNYVVAGENIVDVVKKTDALSLCYMQLDNTSRKRTFT